MEALPVTSLVARANALKAPSPWDKSKQAEVEARRAIEDRCGLIVHDANIVLRANCPNIDLVVFAYHAPIYVQVKSSERPASKDHVTISGAPWTDEELYEGAPIFNKHEGWKAGLVMILHRVNADQTDYYIAPPDELERLVRPRAARLAAKPKKDGQPRSIGFRKELPRDLLRPWKDAWHLLAGEALPRLGL
ncbi:MAG TPA: hypothetical protein VN655_08720 [Pseudolabrys sp.]|nr:hypothetical protein [Pseudolabrys sp.]